MCHLVHQHILLGMTAMLLNAGGSNGNCTVSSSSNSTCDNQNGTPEGCLQKLHGVIGLTVLGFMILLSLACHCITCTIIMPRKDKWTVPVPHKEDKEQTKVEGEEELWYASVKFTGAAKDPDHVTKCDTKSEYATVVINTPALNYSQQDLGDNDICIED